MEFEWDEAKRESNIAKHGIDFIDVQLVFDGCPVRTISSQRDQESRFATTSELEGVFVTVIWTIRESKLALFRQGELVMKRSGNIVSYTAEELEEMRRRGESRTDWARVDAMTEDELEASIDWEEEGTFDLSSEPLELSDILGPKKQITLRLDPSVVDWFKSQGRGYQTRMNAVLRAYVQAHKH
jgi:uncharacterized protein (DUF4415 family)/uncharacterized DUF497 family protein